MSSPGGYDPKQFESEIYAAWEAAGHFHAEPDPSRQPFVITIPPPNVTGALHLGHALNNTLQDILIRRKRMQGFNVCWMPGTDHAGIATQAVVEKRLREEQGWKRDSANPEHRKFLVEKIWDWKEEYNTRILNQLRRMGCSCDWQRTRFTLDEQCAKAVYETFFRFFKDGLIYRGLRLVNWDTQLQTAVADDEVYHETVRGSLWHIRYPIAEGIEGFRDSGIQGKPVGHESAALNPSIPQSLNPSQYLVVATTRPETMLADTAVAVHPEDDRYKHLIGKHVLLPLMDRPIPIVADGMLVKREFGTGCVKVTPGHDPNDYACWQRKLGQLDQIDVRDLLTPDGRIRPDYGPYSGMKKEEARKKVVSDLESLGLLEKVEPYETEVGHSDRSKTPIEPLRSEQWFVKMDKPSGPRLAESAMEAVRDGRVQFFPERYAKTYIDWLGEKRDWCISRQLWWGHRIPVWTKQMSRSEYVAWMGRDDRASDLIGVDDRICLRVTTTDGRSFDLSGPKYEWSEAERYLDEVGYDPIVFWQVCLQSENAVCYFNGEPIAAWLEANGFARDPDVLDTWFSSALWPHSTFGWPPYEGSRDQGNKGSSNPASIPRSLDPSIPSDLDYFYPTSVLSTAREIITLWVARMVMTGLYNVGRVPFQHVYIHAVIQDGQGRRMSKSAGNGVDPLDIIDAYGSDALRFTLAQLATETQDIRIPVKPAQLPDGRTVNTSERFELGRNLVTKLWQAATGFVIPTCKDVTIERRNTASLYTSRDPAEMPLFEKWIRVKLLACIREVDQRLERYEFSAAVDAIRTFFWNDLCDWYIEEVKSHLREAAADDAEKNDVKITLLQTFDIVLCLLHPAIPFVTEAIWAELGREIQRHHELIWPAADSSIQNPKSKIQNGRPPAAPMLIAMPWPKAVPDAEMSAADAAWLREVAAQTAAEREVDTFLAVIRALREIRTSLNAIRSQAKQPALRNLPAAVVRCDPANADLLRRGEATIVRLGQVEKGGLTISPDAPKPPQSMSRVLSVAGSSATAQTIEIYVPIAGLADLDVERKRLAKDRDESAAALQRLESKLANEGFIAKAKPEVIETERARLVELKEKLAAIERNLSELQ